MHHQQLKHGIRFAWESRNPPFYFFDFFLFQLYEKKALVSRGLEVLPKHKNE